MNVTINFNIPEKSLNETQKLLSQTIAPSALRNADLSPVADDQNYVPLQGPPVSMLLFALTVAATDPAANQFMTAAQEAELRANADCYDIFHNSGAAATPTGQNGIDVFKAFIALHPEYLPTLQAAQGIYGAYLAYCTTAKVWSSTCRLKYSQLANIAQTDWLGEESGS